MSLVGEKKVNIIGILDDLRYFISEKNIDKKKFVGKIDYAIRRATKLAHYTSNKVTYGDILNLVSFYVADGDKDLSALISSLIDAYIDVSKGYVIPINDEDYEYLKEIILYYLQK